MALAVAVIIAGFASLNSAPVSVSFLLWRAPEVSLALVIIISVFLGVIMAILFAIPQSVKQLTRISQLQAKLSKYESEAKKSNEEEKKQG
ncbi:MAG: LapA family protein [Candidatus Margulisbacteria bacterium]|nr:LapA family protein [Candidatus Margulisiibacteriota bacterium]